MPTRRKPIATKVEVRASSASPYSIALEGIKRYLNAKGNLLDFAVPLRQIGFPTGLGLEHRVAVTFDPHPNRAIIGRYDDRLELHWHPVPDGPYPSFSGRLTILPLGTGTEFLLKGSYEPPLGAVGAVFDRLAGHRIAEATARALLDEFRTVLEAEFSTLKDVMRR